MQIFSLKKSELAALLTEVWTTKLASDRHKQQYEMIRLQSCKGAKEQSWIVSWCLRVWNQFSEAKWKLAEQQADASCKVYKKVNVKNDLAKESKS